MQDDHRQRCLHASEHLRNAIAAIEAGLESGDDIEIAKAIGHAKAALDQLCK